MKNRKKKRGMKSRRKTHSYSETEGWYFYVPPYIILELTEDNIEEPLLSGLQLTLSVLN
jgi:hypothetical protein